MSDKDENKDDSLQFDVMPGADVSSEEEEAVDLNFGLGEEPKEEETEEVVSEDESTEEAESTAEEPEEVVAEDESEEADEPEQQQEEAEVEEESALAEPPKEAEKPIKKPMVPKSRLDEVLAKQKELQKQLEDMRSAQTVSEDAPDEYDFVAKEVEYQNAVLDGEAEKAAQLRAEIRAAERAQIEFEMTQKMTQTVTQNREVTALQQAATELERAFPQFDKSSEQFDEALTNEVIELRDAFMMKGENAVAALSKAARFVIRDNDLIQTEEAPSLAATNTAVDEVAKKRKEVSRKLKAADAQPPQLPGESSAARGESPLDISNMTEEEFDALPEATLKRLRGDIL